MLSIMILGTGVGLLVGLAVLIGQAQAQVAAWRHIARERRELDSWESDLIQAAESRRCADCPFRVQEGRSS